MKRKPVTIRILKWQFFLFIAISMTGILFSSSLTFRHSVYLVAPMPVRAQGLQPGRRPSFPVTSYSFEGWIDSMRKDKLSGRRLDSLLKARPGLPDSIRTAENYNTFLNFLKK
jgi:hypothetical protein